MDAQDVAGEVAEVAHHASSQIVDEFKKLGSAFLGQIISLSPNANLKHHEVKELAKNDKEFSEAAGAEVAARVKAYYEQYYHLQKKRKEQLEEQQEQKEEEEKKLEDLNERRVVKDQMGVSPEIAKARAEIKNYGAE